MPETFRPCSYAHLATCLCLFLIHFSVAGYIIFMVALVSTKILRALEVFQSHCCILVELCIMSVKSSISYTKNISKIDHVECNYDPRNCKEYVTFCMQKVQVALFNVKNCNQKTV